MKVGQAVALAFVLAAGAFAAVYFIVLKPQYDEVAKKEAEDQAVTDELTNIDKTKLTPPVTASQLDASGERNIADAMQRVDAEKKAADAAAA